jgi:hypothetical protein
MRKDRAMLLTLERMMLGQDEGFRLGYFVRGMGNRYMCVMASEGGLDLREHIPKALTGT